MSRVWAIMRKEFLHILRDARALTLTVLLPVVSLFLLGSAVASDIENIPLAVADQSRTDASREFIDKYTLSRIFSLEYQVENEEEILQLIDSGKVYGGLLIPPEFGRSLLTGEPVKVMFYMDASDPTLGQVMQLAAETISRTSAAEIQIQQLSRRLGISTDVEAPIETRIRFLFNPDMRRLNFIVPALAAMILQAQALLLTGFAIVREREQGTLEQLIVTPIRTWELMLGKILPFVLICFINLWVTLGLGSWWFNVPINGDLGLLALLSLVFLIGSLGLGVLVSTVARTQVQAIHITLFINLPSMIISGFVFPRFNMPLPAYYAGYAFPLTYFIEVIRGITLKGVEVVYLLSAILPMVALSLIVFSLSVILFRKRLE